MDKGSAFFPLPPVVSGAGAQHIEVWKEIWSNFCCSLYEGEGRCSAENEHFRAVAWGAPFVTFPPPASLLEYRLGEVCEKMSAWNSEVRYFTKHA